MTSSFRKGLKANELPGSTESIGMASRKREERREGMNWSYNERLRGRRCRIYVSMKEGTETGAPRAVLNDAMR